MTLLSLEEAAEKPGVYVDSEGLELWFSPLPNWYIFTGTACPRCEQPIKWTWKGKLPGFTTPQSIEASGVKPVVTGARLEVWGHRFLIINCEGCGTSLFAHNFDHRANP